jgi:hypothetical protein
MGLKSKLKIIDIIIRWLNQERISPSSFPLSDFEKIRYEVKPGDVILVEGRTRVSDVIKRMTQSRWSHAALYVGRLHDIENPLSRQRVKSFFDGQPNVQLIIESELGKGTIVRPLSSYERDHIRICRPRNLSYKQSQQIINYSVSRLGTDYDIRQILDLARLLIPWTIFPRRWRSSLFNVSAGKATKTVCSTMIAEAFSSIQYPILPLVKRDEKNEIRVFRRNPRLCTPSDFDYSPYFDIIKYPFFDLTPGSKDSRLIPWGGKDTLSEEESGEFLE